MSVPEHLHDFRVELVPLPNLAHVRSLWLELESRVESNYFQSWAWIGPWLQLVCPSHIAHLLTVNLADRLVGIGVLTKRRRFFGLGPLHLRLHETGNRALDDITIEYNGLLSEQGLEREVLTAAIAHLACHDRHWLTLHLPGIESRLLPEEGFDGLGLDERRAVRVLHSIDLDALRNGPDDYVASLRSVKTRANLRLTERKLAARHGTPSLLYARSDSERREYFHGLIALHQAHWTTRRNHNGAFADPRILRFHEKLIDAARDGEGPQLFRIVAGDATVGYNYTLARRGVMYGYQLGIDYSRFGDCGSPGLLTVALTIQHALQQGYSRFELMAGDTGYKRALGMHEHQMLWLSLDRRNWQSRLRKAWHSLRKLTPA